MRDYFDKGEHLDRRERFDRQVNLAGIVLVVEIAEDDLTRPGIAAGPFLAALGARLRAYFSPAHIHFRTTAYAPTHTVTDFMDHPPAVHQAIKEAVAARLPGWLEEARQISERYPA